MDKRCMGCMENFPEELEVCPNCGYIVDSQVEEAIHIVPGSLLDDRYIIGKVLGYGSFGVTYIAWDGKLKRKVAIKEYMPSEFCTRIPGQSFLKIFNDYKSKQFQDGLEKFIDEAKKLAKFNNEPGIVNIFDCIRANGTAYIVMELLEGETLGDKLKKETIEIKEKKGTGIRSIPIPVEEAISLLLPIMNSLVVVHEEGIVHRDIAPDNIFITKNGEAKLIDFGAARYATTSHSRSLTTIVKPGYSPKEQYDSHGDQGPHTDVYALAATLYKMITGKTPPEAMGRNATCETKHRDPLIEPHKIIKNISLNYENALMNALNIRIEDRTSDVKTLISELCSDMPVKRKYGKIKKIDLYRWPIWIKILIPLLMSIIIVFGTLLATGAIKFNSLFSDAIVVPNGMVIVPEVEGLDKDDALIKIENIGLTPSPEGNIESKYVEAGKIVLQTPQGGTYIEKSGKVTLTVSSGAGVVEAENGIATVPYVVWDTIEDATAKLIKAGLGTPIIEYKYNGNVAAGRIINQSLGAGEEVAEKTVITLVVSKGTQKNNISTTTSVLESSITNNTEYNKKKYVKNISFNSNEKTIYVGEKVYLSATSNLDSEYISANEKRTWESDNPSVASVNNGDIEALKPGLANVTVKSYYNGELQTSATCKITVSGDPGLLWVGNTEGSRIWYVTQAENQRGVGRNSSGKITCSLNDFPIDFVATTNADLLGKSIDAWSWTSSNTSVIKISDERHGLNKSSTAELAALNRGSSIITVKATSDSKTSMLIFEIVVE